MFAGSGKEPPRFLRSSPERGRPGAVPPSSSTAGTAQLFCKAPGLWTLFALTAFHRNVTSLTESHLSCSLHSNPVRPPKTSSSTRFNASTHGQHRGHARPGMKGSPVPLPSPSQATVPSHPPTPRPGPEFPSCPRSPYHTTVR